MLLGKNVRYMQARALAGQPSILKQQKKAAAMDSLEGKWRSVYLAESSTAGLMAHMLSPRAYVTRACFFARRDWSRTLQECVRIAQGFRPHVHVSLVSSSWFRSVANAKAMALLIQNTNQLCEGRGCTFESTPIVPDQVAFECGGMKDAQSCLSSVQTCVDVHEEAIKKYYEVRLGEDGA